jgi:hypothetical protein
MGNFVAKRICGDKKTNSSRQAAGGSQPDGEGMAADRGMLAGGWLFEVTWARSPVGSRLNARGEWRIVIGDGWSVIRDL